MFVVNGSLELTRRSDDTTELLISTIHAHELVGGLTILTGEPAFYAVKARQFSRVAVVKRQDFYQYIDFLLEILEDLVLVFRYCCWISKDRFLHMFHAD